MNALRRRGAHARWILSLTVTATVLLIPFAPDALQAAGQAAGAPQVEIKKHTTGKEATVTHGDREWFIHIDVDQDRTMIIRAESKSGKETKNEPEIVERPMSNVEVDQVINDFVSGIKSTLKP